MSNNPGLIFVCTSAIKFCTIIVESFEQKMKAIALDPTKGFMFYTKWDNPSLDRSHMDGSNATSLVYSKIIYPLGLTLDLANEHVYWVDQYMDLIERVDYNGKNRWSHKKNPAAHSHLKSLHSVVVFESTIYVATNYDSPHNSSIFSMPKHGRDVKRVVRKLSRPSVLHFFHRQRQPEVAHPCREHNGGCNQLCIPHYKKSIVTAQCVCSPGYRLVLNSCELVHSTIPFLMYSKQNPGMIKGITMHSLAATSSNRELQEQAMIPILISKSFPVRFDFNAKDQLIYFGQFDRFAS